jgi:glucose 1-dehydrogenase
MFPPVPKRDECIAEEARNSQPFRPQVGRRHARKKADAIFPHARDNQLRSARMSQVGPSPGSRNISIRSTVKLQNRVAIVTGAATGIGKAIAKALAAEGAAIVIDYVGDPSSANVAVQDIQAAGGKCLAVAADVSSPDEVNQLVQKTLESWGRLDILVNNAGLEYKRPFIEFPFELWQRVIAVDLTGPFLCAQAASREMIRQGGGRIINISSVHEDLPMPTNAPYCAAKGGLRMLMRTIAVELAPYKITVNNIAPGAIFTPIDADVESNPQMEGALMAEIPLGRWGKPEEVAGLAVFLASDAASYCTGGTFFIDGGMIRQAGHL